MKTKAIGHDTVIMIAKKLVETHGDVNRTYEILNRTIPKKLILRVREKRILPSVTDEFFTKGQFKSQVENKSSAIDIGDVGNISYGMETTSPELVDDKEHVPKKKRRPPLSEEQVREVCEALIRHNGSVPKVLKEIGGDVTTSQIVNIKSGHTRLDISRKYFTVKPWTPITITTPTIISEPVTEIIPTNNELNEILSNTPRHIEMLASGKIKTTWPLPRIMEMVNTKDPKTTIESLFMLVDNCIGQLSLEQIIRIIQE